MEALNVSVEKRWVTENDKTENDIDAKTKGNLLEEARSVLFSVTLVIKYVFESLFKKLFFCLGHKNPLYSLRYDSSDENC